MRQFCGIFVEPEANRRDHKEAEGLVELSWVPGDIVDATEDEAPGTIGWHAQYFGVHQVTEPNKSAGHEAWSGQEVKQWHKGGIFDALFKEVERDNDAQETTMTRKATFPDVEDLDRIREIVARLVEEAVA